MERYGIGTTKKTKITLHVRSRNYDAVESNNLYDSWIYEWKDLDNTPQDSTASTSRNLFGHKG